MRFLNFEGQHLNYVIETKPLAGNENLLQQLKNNANEIKTHLLVNKSFQKKIMLTLTKEWEEIPETILLNKLITLKFLLNRIWFESKEQLNNSFRVLKEIDLQFYDLIFQCLISPGNVKKNFFLLIELLEKDFT
ncbi:MAG: hypothetical protein ACEPO8_08415 [Rhodothermaceae bacterium]